MSTPKPQPITVGVPHDLPDGRSRYPIVRGDGRLIFVEEYDDGTAQIMLAGKSGPEPHGGIFLTVHGAIESAKTLLGGMA